MDSWADEFPLYIWSGTEAADLTPVKDAVAELRQFFGQGAVPKVVPIGTSLHSPPPLDARVLAIGHAPTFLCDYILIDPVAPNDEWQDALAWVMQLHENGKATTLIDTMQSIFGVKTREITEAEQDAERKMDDFMYGRD